MTIRVSVSTSRVRVGRHALGGAIALMLTGGAHAATVDAYPTKPIRLIVPYSAGGGSDAVGRSLMQRLSERLGQPIVYDNRGGAGATIGTNLAAKSAPDGYTMLYSLNALTIAASIYPKLPYDPLKDLAPVTQMLNSSSILVAHPALGVRSVKELIASVKSNPGKLNYGSQGIGTNAHMTMELLRKATGIDVTHIPYKGGGELATAIMTGQVQLCFLATSFGAPYVNTGKVVPLAVSTGKRLPAFPDLPTLNEAGVPGAARNEYSGWWGLFMPAATPAARIDRVQRDFAAVVALPDIRELMFNRGMEPVASRPHEFAAMLREDLARWKKVARDSGITAQ